jgi:hypothetical protein
VKGLDYSLGPPAPDKIKAAGFGYVMRYLPFSGSWRQDLTPQEFRGLVDAGIGVGLIWETTAGRAGEGYAAGTRDAELADVAAWKATGFDEPAVWFTVDFDVPPHKEDDVVEYFRGIMSVMPLSRIFVYASYRICQLLREAHVVMGCWQTTAWSRGNWDANHMQIQRIPQVVVDRVQCDVNEWNVEAHPDMPGIYFANKKGGVVSDLQEWEQRRLFDRTLSAAMGVEGQNFHGVQFQHEEDWRQATTQQISALAGVVAAATSNPAITPEFVRDTFAATVAEVNTTYLAATEQRVLAALRTAFDEYQADQAEIDVDAWFAAVARRLGAPAAPNPNP